MESLAVENPVRTPKPAKSISDAGCGELVRQLPEYKVNWYGHTLVRIDRPLVLQFPAVPCLLGGQ